MITLLCPSCHHEVEVSSLQADVPASCPLCGSHLPASGSADSHDPPTAIGSLHPETATRGTTPTLVTPAISSYPFLEPPRQPDELGWLGHYRILKILGQGGMGIVFQAEDTNLER